MTTIRRCPARDIDRMIAAYYDRMAANPHHRYRSWEHCYRFFHSRPRELLVTDKNEAAVQLGFYLASWGMYRGSTFLLQRSYTVHEAVIERIVSPEFSPLWEQEVGSIFADGRLIRSILALVAAVKHAYSPFGQATDTLASKVILGTVACLPACDRFFVDGFTASGRHYSRLNARFVERIVQFCVDCSAPLRAEQARIHAAGGMHYPLMKLADMYFWQIGFEAAARKLGREPQLGG